MKRLLALSLICSAIAIGTVAFAQYDPNFIGPQQQQADPFAQDGGGLSAQCGPQANGQYILCEAVGGLLHQTQTDFASFLHELYILAFILAGTVAFVRIVYGGILYSWSGVVDRKKEAIKIFWDVAYGMLLLMGSYLILNTVNPALTAFNLPDISMAGLTANNNPIQSDGLPTPLSALTKAEDQIRQENLDIIRNLGMYGSSVEKQTTIDLINEQMRQIGTPDTPEQDKRLAELQGMLIQIEKDETQVKAGADAVTNTPPARYQRTKP